MALPIDTEIYNLREWCDWLELELGLKLGKDFKWAWVNNKWAIWFSDPKVELLVTLKRGMHESLY
jgi:hypothetical protein